MGNIPLKVIDLRSTMFSYSNAYQKHEYLYDTKIWKGRQKITRNEQAKVNQKWASLSRRKEEGGVGLRCIVIYNGQGGHFSAEPLWNWNGLETSYFFTLKSLLGIDRQWSLYNHITLHYWVDFWRGKLKKAFSKLKIEKSIPKLQCYLQ